MKGKIEVTLATQRLWDKWDWVASFLSQDKTILAAAVGLIAWTYFFKWVKANLLLVPFCILTCSTKEGNDTKGEAGCWPCTCWEHGCLSAAQRAFWVPNMGGFCFADSHSSTPTRQMERGNSTDRVLRVGRRSSQELWWVYQNTCHQGECFQHFPLLDAGFVCFDLWIWTIRTEITHAIDLLYILQKSVVSKKFYCFPLIFHLFRRIIKLGEALMTSYKISLQIQERACPVHEMISTCYSCGKYVDVWLCSEPGCVQRTSWRRSIQQRTLNKTGAPGEKINRQSFIKDCSHAARGERTDLG